MSLCKYYYDLDHFCKNVYKKKKTSWIDCYIMFLLSFFAFKVDAHRHNVENEMKLSLISIEIGLADLL